MLISEHSNKSCVQSYRVNPCLYCSWYTQYLLNRTLKTSGKQQWPVEHVQTYKSFSNNGEIEPMHVLFLEGSLGWFD